MIIFKKGSDWLEYPKKGYKEVDLSSKDFRKLKKEKDFLKNEKVKINCKNWGGKNKIIEISSEDFQKLKKGKFSIKKNKLVKEKSFKKSRYSVVKTLWDNKKNKLVVIFPDGTKKVIN